MYCSTTSYSEFSSLRQHMCISSQILWMRNLGTACTGPKVQGLLQGCSQDFGLPQSFQGSIQIDRFSSKLSQWLLIGLSVSQAVGLSMNFLTAIAGSCSHFLAIGFLHRTAQNTTDDFIRTARESSDKTEVTVFYNLKWHHITFAEFYSLEGSH